MLKMKKLVKKALPIIMSAMVVTSMTAISMTTASATSTYVNEETGVKFESDAITITGNDVGVYTYWDSEDEIGLYEERYDIEMSTMDINYDEVPITLYLPCEKENCYVILEGFESSERVQLDAEYVDGCYKVRMPNWGTYYICDTPLVSGYSTLEQQTLTDEKTGVSVSGKIETGSTLISFDVQDMYNGLTEAGEDYFPESPYATIGEFDGYGVFLTRNMEDAYTEGELTVTLPWPEEGYEVRCISAYAPMSDDDGCEEEVLGFELTSTMELSDEELAQRYTTLMDKVHPALDAEYVNGSYVVKGNISGYYFIAPKGAFTITAEKINKIRSGYSEYTDYDDEYIEYEGSTDGQAVLLESEDDSEESTKLEPATVKKATTTKSGDSEKTSGSNNIIVPVVIAVVAVVVLGTVVVIICKKKSAKK